MNWSNRNLGERGFVIENKSKFSSIGGRSFNSSSNTSATASAIRATDKFVVDEKLGKSIIRREGKSNLFAIETISKGALTILPFTHSVKEANPSSSKPLLVVVYTTDGASKGQPKTVNDV